MTTASTQLRALEGEITERKRMILHLDSDDQDLKLADRAVTIAKEMEKALAHEIEERDYARKELAECNKDTSAEIQSLRTENSTLKRRLDEAMKELEVSRNTIAALQIRRQYGSSLDNLI